MTRSQTCSRQPVRATWSCEHLEHARALALRSAIDASSAVAYSSALNSYISFCRLHNFPIDPTPDTLSFYTIYMAHHIKPSSVDSYLSGICNELESFHPDVRKNRWHQLITKTLRGCKKLHAIPTTRKRPLSRAELADPNRPFRKYLQSRDKLFPFHPQLWLCADGSVPTRGWFIRRLHQHFPSDVGGHSLRAGGATALAQAGIPPHIIQAIGRWASDTFQIYIRHHPVLLAALLFSNTPSSH